MQFVVIVDRFKVTFLLYPADLYIWKQHLLPNGCSEQLMEAHVFWTRGDRLQWHHRLAVWGWERRCRVIQPGTRDLWYKFKNVTSLSVGFKCLQIRYSLYLCLKVRHKAGIFIIQPPFLHDHTRVFLNLTFTLSCHDVHWSTALALKNKILYTCCHAARSLLQGRNDVVVKCTA